MTAELELGENEIPVQRHFKGPARAVNELYPGSGVGRLDLCRQTGGSWLVVSGNAVLYGDLHHSSPRVEGTS